MGILWYRHVTWKRATVKSVRATRKALKKYDSTLELEVAAGGKAGTGSLTAHREQARVPADLVHWPTAVRVEELPSEDAFENENLWWDAVYDLHEKRGDQGFIDLLLELAPCLTSPFIVQAAEVTSDGDFIRAKEWTSRPDATEVEIKEIVPLREE
jgi:hypothetical protein